MSPSTDHVTTSIAASWNKDNFEAAMAMANFKREVREERMSHEWTIHLAIWASIGSVAYFVAQTQVPLWGLVTFAVATLVFHVFFTKSHFDRSERDANQMYYYFYLAGHVLQPEVTPEPAIDRLAQLPGPLGFLSLRRLNGQAITVGATVVLLLAMLVIAGTAPDPTATS